MNICVYVFVHVCAWFHLSLGVDLLVIFANTRIQVLFDQNTETTLHLAQNETGKTLVKFLFRFNGMDLLKSSLKIEKYTVTSLWKLHLK